MDDDEEENGALVIGRKDLTDFELAVKGKAGTQVLALYHLVDDEDKEVTFHHQILRALLPGRLPGNTQVFSDQATLMWRDKGLLLADNEVAHRNEGADFILFGRIASFWPPPLVTPFGDMGRWSSDCWEVVFPEPPSKDFLKDQAEACNWAGATWFRKGASPRL